MVKVLNDDGTPKPKTQEQIDIMGAVVDGAMKDPELLTKLLKLADDEDNADNVGMTMALSMVAMKSLASLIQDKSELKDMCAKFEMEEKELIYYLITAASVGIVFHQLDGVSAVRLGD